MLGTIIGLIIIGLIAGFIARAVVPGRQSLSILQTILLYTGHTRPLPRMRRGALTRSSD